MPADSSRRFKTISYDIQKKDIWHWNLFSNKRFSPRPSPLGKKDASTNNSLSIYLVIGTKTLQAVWLVLPSHHQCSFLSLRCQGGCAVLDPCLRLVGLGLGCVGGTGTWSSFEIRCGWTVPLVFWCTWERHRLTIVQSSWWCKQGTLLSTLP